MPAPTYAQLYSECKRCMGTGVNQEDPDNPDMTCKCCDGLGKVPLGFVSFDDILKETDKILKECDKILKEVKKLTA